MSKKDDLDKYYTKASIAKQCADILRDVIPPHQRHNIIEPSAGAGVFLPFFKNIIGYDLKPEADGIIEKNFFDVTQTSPPKTTTILGNPPFGKNSSLAIKFFNHATTLGNTIAFIIPKAFRKLSVQKRLDKNYHLIFDAKIPPKSFLLHGEQYHVDCCFQIWQYRKEKRVITYPENPYFEFIKKSQATKHTFCIRRSGHKAGRILKGLDHSEGSTYFVNPKTNHSKVLLFMRWLDGSITDVVSNTVATKSISRGELAESVTKAIEYYTFDKDGTKREHWIE